MEGRPDRSLIHAKPQVPTIHHENKQIKSCDGLQCDIHMSWTIIFQMIFYLYCAWLIITKQHLITQQPAVQKYHWVQYCDLFTGKKRVFLYDLIGWLVESWGSAVWTHCHPWNIYTANAVTSWNYRWKYTMMQWHLTTE